MNQEDPRTTPGWAPTAMFTPSQPVTRPRSRRCRTRLLAALALIASVSLAAHAHAKPLTQTVSVQSDALAGERRYHVYVPPGYHRSSKRYPVIILLHGLGGRGSDWFVSGHLAKTVDRLIKTRAIAPVILVAPDGGDGYWTDHRPTPESQPSGHDYGRFVADELLADVDRRLRTRLGERAIAGVSMGGHGALSLALQFPERFRSVVSLGGALFPSPPSHRAVYKRVWGDPVHDAHWQRTSPIALMTRLPSRAAAGTPAGSATPAIYLQCGDDDGYGFLPYALGAHEILATRGVPHELRVSDGGHSWSVWREAAVDWLRFVDHHWTAAASPKR